MLRFITSRRSKKRLFAEVLIAVVLISSISLFAYLRMAQGATYTWDGGGTEITCPGNSNGWSCAENWSTDIVPTSSDTAQFNNTSDKDSTIDASFGGSVAAVTIASGYDGTITQSRSLAISGSFSQASGTWTGGAQSLTMNGNFTVSGGVHNATTGTFQVELDFTHSGGTLNMNSSTVEITSDYFLDNTTITCSGTLGGSFDFIKNTVVSGSEPTITIANGCEITLVPSTTSFQANLVNNGTLNAGDITMDSNFTQNGTLNMSGTLYIVSNSYLDSSTISCTGTLGPTVNLNKDDESSGSSGDFTIDTGCEVTIADNGFTVSDVTNDGTINATNLRFDGSFTQAGTLNMTGTLTLGGASIWHSATLTCTGGTLSTQPMTLVLNKTDNNPTFTFGSDCTIGSFTRTNGVVGNPGAARVISLQGDFSMSTSDQMGGANLTLDFSGTADQTITVNAGSISSPVTVNKTAGTVSQLTAISIPSLTITDGEYLNSTFALTISGTLTVNDTFTQGSGHVTIGTLTIGAAGNFTNPSTGNLIVGAGGVGNSGNIVIGVYASCPTTDGRAITSSSPSTQRSWTGGGTTTVYDTQVTDQGGTAAINAFSSTSVSGNGNNWTFYNDTECVLPVNPRVQGGSRLRGGTKLN